VTWTSDAVVNRDLPNLFSNTSDFIMSETQPLDYCDACIQHVRTAIDRAKAERKIQAQP
jgi:hypothetical protein